MKKVERPVRTERFEAVLVHWEMTAEDFSSAKQPEVPENYLMIGPPGGPLARLDGVDASIVMLLLSILSHSAHAHPGRVIGRGPVGPVGML